MSTLYGIQPLVSSVTDRPASPIPPPPTSGHRRCKQSWFRRQHRVFPKSKGALMILLWNIIVGFTYGALLSLTAALSVSFTGPLHYVIYIELGGFTLIALIQLLSYPVGGLLADLCCGRYRIVSLSIFKIWLGTVLISIVCMTYISNGFEEGEARPFVIFLATAAFIVLAAGFTGFQANAVQFGLDQLLDAPSAELSIFLHWYEWTENLGEMLARLITSTFACNEFMLEKVSAVIPPVCVIAGGVVLAFSYYKRKWFHCEPRTHNPYGMVYHVLKFVARHNRPVRPPSAFTYCDDEIPTRIEFAKQRFGGPFSTETVEDVKTFLRILAMLLLVTPVFNLHIASSYILPLYGIYFGEKPPSFTDGCTPAWMFLQSGSSSYIVTILFLPPYIMFIHPNLTRCMPRILHRLLLGIVLLIATVAIMLGLLMVAKHAALQGEGRSDLKCLFQAEVRAGIKNDTVSSRLHYHTPLLIIPSIITGITIPLTYITIMEFISSQSPHTMKGLLLGVFYAFRGLFIMLGCIFMFPFVQPEWWEDSNGSLFDCGFSYYLTSTVFGVVGIVTVSLGVKWYHYRDRQDRPYGPSYVEEYYSRYNRNARSTTMVTSASEEEAEEVGLLHAEINNSILAYGTMDGT